MLKITEIPLDTIQPSPFQRRRHFDVAGLAETIKNQGLLEPIIVRPVNGHSELVDGDRRVRAYRLTRTGSTARRSSRRSCAT